MQLLTDEQAGALALRLVACKGWRWLPGMLTLASDDGPPAIVVCVGDGLLEIQPGAVELELLGQWRAAYQFKLGRSPEAAEEHAARNVIVQKLGREPLGPPPSASGLVWAREPELVQLRGIVDGEGEP